MASGWPSFAIFMALLSLSMINSAESRLKVSPIFPPKMSFSTYGPIAADSQSSTTPSRDISGSVRVHPVPRAAQEESEGVHVHPIPKAGALNTLSSTTPSQEVSRGVRLHPVPRAVIGVDAHSTFPVDYQDHMYESLVRVHPVPKAGALFEPAPPIMPENALFEPAPPIMPENNARVHLVPKARSAGVEMSPPPRIPDYKTFGPTMDDRVMAMAPTKI